jgi:hypothetical protein
MLRIDLPSTLMKPFYRSAPIPETVEFFRGGRARRDAAGANLPAPKTCRRFAA